MKRDVKRMEEEEEELREEIQKKVNEETKKEELRQEIEKHEMIRKICIEIIERNERVKEAIEKECKKYGTMMDNIEEMKKILEYKKYIEIKSKTERRII